MAAGVGRLAPSDILLTVAEVRDGINATIRAVVLGAVALVLCVFLALDATPSTERTLTNG